MSSLSFHSLICKANTPPYLAKRIGVSVQGAQYMAKRSLPLSQELAGSPVRCGFGPSAPSDATDAVPLTRPCPPHCTAGSALPSPEPALVLQPSVCGTSVGIKQACLSWQCWPCSSRGSARCLRQPDCCKA